MNKTAQMATGTPVYAVHAWFALPADELYPTFVPLHQHTLIILP
jgi:hypothetical protein